MRYYYLDNLRALFALTVCIFHVIRPAAQWGGLYLFDLNSYIDKSPLEFYLKIITLLFSGEVAVYCFFTLSGFVLFLSPPTRAPFKNFFLFQIKRLIRLMPSHLIVLACILGFTYVISHFTRLEPFTWDNAWQNVILWQFQANPVTWSLQHEFIAGLYLLPLYFAWKFGGRWSFATALVLYASIYIGAYFCPTLNEAVAKIIQKSLFFVVGLCGALFFQSSRFQSIQPYTFSAVCAALNLYICYTVVTFTVFRDQGRFTYDLIVAAMALSLIFHCAKLTAPAKRSWLNRLGMVSYEFYLWNYFIIYSLIMLVNYTIHPFFAYLNWGYFGVGLLFASILLSTLFAFLTERTSRYIQTRIHSLVLHTK